ncbi:MAG TPA: glycosyltransferase 87 family protein [Actinomycetota bacterium]|nr:glycosyltransferase 87 family protein [Actinomycetota bacterium]
MLTRSLDRISERTSTAIKVVVALFVVTRLFGAAGAINFPTSSDVEIAYRPWAIQVVDKDRAPYSEVDIEYPPASLPFVLAPQVPSPDQYHYRINFVLAMLVADIAAFIGLMMLSKRWGSLLGPWLWVIALPLLGPFVYLRLDLIPTAAMIWALQRASRDDWLGGGGFLGFGIAAKLFPLLLVPLALLIAPARSRLKLLIGAGAVVLIAFLPFMTILNDLFRDIVEYHTGRGIQVESLWGSMLYVARSGEELKLIFHDFGAHHFRFGAVETMKTVASIATAATLVIGIWLAKKAPKDVRELASVSCVTLLMAITVSGVLSPQFFMWIAGLGAVSLCAAGSRLRNLMLMLLPLLLLTQVIYPTMHPALVRAEAPAVVMLWCRNILLLLTAIYGVASVSGPSTRGPASVGTP